MERTELSWNAELTSDQLSQAVAENGAEFSLTVGTEMEQKSIPGSQHWHLKRDKERGVLEVTLVARTKSGFVSVHANRTAPWVEELLPQFRDRLDRKMNHGRGYVPLAEPPGGASAL